MGCVYQISLLRAQEALLKRGRKSPRAREGGGHQEKKAFYIIRAKTEAASTGPTQVCARSAVSVLWHPIDHVSRTLCVRTSGSLTLGLLLGLFSSCWVTWPNLDVLALLFTLVDFILLLSLRSCFLSNERQKGRGCGWEGGGGEVGVAEERETVIRVCAMSKPSIFNKRRKGGRKMKGEFA